MKIKFKIGDVIVRKSRSNSDLVFKIVDIIPYYYSLTIVDSLHPELLEYKLKLLKLDIDRTHKKVPKLKALLLYDN